MIKGTLQSFPVILMNQRLVLANYRGKYNRKPAMHTFYYQPCYCPISTDVSMGFLVKCQPEQARLALSSLLSHNLHPSGGVEII